MVGDMIALRPLTWFLPLDPYQIEKEIVNAESEATLLPYPENVPVPGKSEADCINPHPFRMLVNIGGWQPRYGYMRTYQVLTGRSIIYGHDNSSLVTHSILVYKPYMVEFLSTITAEKYRHLPHGWALSITDAVVQLRVSIASWFGVLKSEPRCPLSRQGWRGRRMRSTVKEDVPERCHKYRADG